MIQCFQELLNLSRFSLPNSQIEKKILKKKSRGIKKYARKRKEVGLLQSFLETNQIDYQKGIEILKQNLKHL